MAVTGLAFDAGDAAAVGDDLHDAVDDVGRLRHLQDVLQPLQRHRDHLGVVQRQQAAQRRDGPLLHQVQDLLRGACTAPSKDQLFPFI